jgi:hypothetical protein
MSQNAPWSVLSMKYDEDAGVAEWEGVDPIRSGEDARFWAELSRAKKRLAD